MKHITLKFSIFSMILLSSLMWSCKEELPVKEKEFIDHVSLFIEKNLHKQDFGIERITEEFGLSRSNLYKTFKVTTNVSPKDFIKEIRMKKAVRLLKENNLTASEIAYVLGFSSATNFFTAFKSYYGKTPKGFQKEAGNHTYKHIHSASPDMLD